MGTRIVFTGDIAFSAYFSDAWQNENLFSSEIHKYFNAAEYVVANVEGPLTENNFQNARLLRHASSPKVGKILYNANIRYWNLANNHIMDCAADGLLDTLQYAEQAGCVPFGVGRNRKEASQPLILGTDVRVGLLAVCKPWKFLTTTDVEPSVLTWNHVEQIRNSIAEMKRTVDWIVLVVHGGDEYAHIAFPYMRQQYRSLLDLGADIIVAHHPHVVQNYELRNNKAIFYSLGNFVFDTDNQRNFSHTDLGVLLGINFGKEDFQFDHLSVRNDRESGTLVKADRTPTVFCNLDEAEYQKLWPLEARLFYPKLMENRKKISRGLAKASPFVAMLYRLYMCRKRTERVVHAGRLRSCFGGWKRSSMNDLIEYIKE